MLSWDNIQAQLSGSAHDYAHMAYRADASMDSVLYTTHSSRCRSSQRRGAGKITLGGLKAILGLAWLFGCFRDHLGGDLHERCHDADDSICAHVARALKQLTGCSGQDGQVTGTRPHGT